MVSDLTTYWQERSRVVRERANLANNWHRQEIRIATIERMKSDIQKAFDWMFWVFEPRDVQRKGDPLREFIPFAYQRIVIREMNNSIVYEPCDLFNAKSRDRGLSRIAQCTLLYHWLFTPNFSAAVTSHKEEAIDTMGDPGSWFGFFRWELQQIDKAMPGIVPANWEKTSGFMKLVNPANGNSIVGLAATKNFAIGNRKTVVVIDEMARMEPTLQQEIDTATYDVADTRWLISSLKGITNLFGQRYLELRKDPDIVVDMLGERETVEEDKGIRLLQVHWTLDPRDNEGCYLPCKDGTNRLISWKEAYKAFLANLKPSSPWHAREVERRLKAGGSPQSVAEEIDMDPVASGRPVFPGDRMAAGIENSIDPKRRIRIDTEKWESMKAGSNTRLWDMIDSLIVTDPKGTIHIWSEPEPKVPYIVFGDPSENVRETSDSASFAVANTITGKIVATGKGTWQPDEFAIVLCVMGYYYNEALLVVECNSVGMSVIMVIAGRIAIRPGEKTETLEEEWLYRRLYTETIEEHIGERKSTRLGFRTGRNNRRKLITAQSRHMRHDVKFCQDRRYWAETLGFIVTERGRVHNPNGDDLVISVGGAVFLSPEGRVYVPNKRKSRGRSNGDPWRKAMKLYQNRDYGKLIELSGLEVEVG